jgi:hypothetical protein
LNQGLVLRYDIIHRYIDITEQHFQADDYIWSDDIAEIEYQANQINIFEEDSNLSFQKRQNLDVVYFG